MGSGKLIKKAINKYGIKNFFKETLYLLSNEDELNKKEKELVTINFCLRKDTYNICEGGFGGGFRYINRLGLNMYGYNGLHIESLNSLENGRNRHLKLLKEDTKYKDNFVNKISLIKKEYFKTHEAHFKGQTHSEETLIKMKGHSRQDGEKNSQYGKPRSEETKRKISESLKKKFNAGIV